MKMRKVLNLARSAKAPVMRAGVMMANIIWKIMNASCGITAPSAGSSPTSLRPKNDRSPMSPPWLGPNARL